MEKDPPEQLKHLGKIIETQSPRASTDTVGEVMEISHHKLPPMPENWPLCSITISIQNVKYS